MNLNASPTLAAFRGTIGGRIASLAKTHTLLTTKRWRAIAFRDILQSELEPYRQTAHVNFDGPDFDLEAEIATTIGMVIHELTTNAAKYGALSSPDGRIDIGWAVETAKESDKPAMVSLTWQERGGPEVQQQTHKGFGSTLIEQLIVRQFGGSTEFVFAPAGLLFSATFTISFAA